MDYAQDKSGIGLPIGNLTSQILANMYLDQFDRFVRHALKPLAYVRYGDDFLIFARTKRDARQFRQLSIVRLHQMGLTLHNSQDVVIRSWQGLHFLGHRMSHSYTLVESKLEKSIKKNVNLKNITSYSSLNLRPETISYLPWIINLDM